MQCAVLESKTASQRYLQELRLFQTGQAVSWPSGRSLHQYSDEFDKSKEQKDIKLKNKLADIPILLVSNIDKTGKVQLFTLRLPKKQSYSGGRTFRGKMQKIVVNYKVDEFGNFKKIAYSNANSLNKQVH